MKKTDNLKRCHKTLFKLDLKTKFFILFLLINIIQIQAKNISREGLITDSVSISEQNAVTVNGVVKDEFNMPIPGVNVLVKGTTKGTVTDFDGNFNITVSDTNAVLVFSYIGYKSKDVLVGNQSTINIVLEQDINELDAVVMVGYGSVKNLMLLELYHL